MTTIATVTTENGAIVQDDQCQDGAMSDSPPVVCERVSDFQARRKTFESLTSSLSGHASMHIPGHAKHTVPDQTVENIEQEIQGSHDKCRTESSSNTDVTQTQQTSSRVSKNETDYTECDKLIDFKAKRNTFEKLTSLDRPESSYPERLSFNSDRISLNRKCASLDVESSFNTDWKPTPRPRASLTKTLSIESPTDVDVPSPGNPTSILLQQEQLETRSYNENTDKTVENEKVLIGCHCTESCCACSETITAVDNSSICSQKADKILEVTNAGGTDLPPSESVTSQVLAETAREVDSVCSSETTEKDGDCLRSSCFTELQNQTDKNKDEIETVTNSCMRIKPEIDSNSLNRKSSSKESKFINDTFRFLVEEDDDDVEYPDCHATAVATPTTLEDDDSSDAVQQMPTAEAVLGCSDCWQHTLPNNESSSAMTPNMAAGNTADEVSIQHVEGGLNGDSRLSHSSTMSPAVGEPDKDNTRLSAEVVLRSPGRSKRARQRSDQSPDGHKYSTEDSDDDADAGIYSETFRYSSYVFVGEEGLDDVLDEDSEVQDLDHGLRSISMDESSSDQSDQHNSSWDNDLPLDVASPKVFKSRYSRSESVSTTLSEVEFRQKHRARTRMIQRQSSKQVYNRASEGFYDIERLVTVMKSKTDKECGFHIVGSNPVMVSTVLKGGAADKAGLVVGDVLITVNGVSVIEAGHDEVTRLCAYDSEKVDLGVSSGKLTTDKPLCTGYLVKQGGSLLKVWRRRWFVLKPDNCLYYYKTSEDNDPLGAIVLHNYTVNRALDVDREFTFKIVKYKQRTYYLQAESIDDMNRWASAVERATKAGTNTDQYWLDVSSHNVGLSALSIKRPDCHGLLYKFGPRNRPWKKRYCVLKDGCLYSYIDQSSSTAQGVAHLHGYTVIGSLPHNKKFGFMLSPPENKMKTFYFYADNETDKNRWVGALETSIGKWVRIDD